MHKQRRQLEEINIYWCQLCECFYKRQAYILFFNNSCNPYKDNNNSDNNNNDNNNNNNNNNNYKNNNARILYSMHQGCRQKPESDVDF